ncbi:hypothetical protein [Bacillus thuringiensis]|uniref:hypothetical protein n=1 Tax=Bacillus thuringiensis TaxID=1428 RepID=UPI003B97D4B1
MPNEINFQEFSEKLTKEQIDKLINAIEGYGFSTEHIDDKALFSATDITVRSAQFMAACVAIVVNNKNVDPKYDIAGIVAAMNAHEALVREQAKHSVVPDEITEV